MKNKFFFLIAIVSLQIFAQENYLKVNHDSISYSDFIEKYQANINSEGIQKAVSTYIEFALLRQEAVKTDIDTTAVFRRIFGQNIQPYKDKYLYNQQVKEELTNTIWRNLQTDKKIEVYAIGIANPYNPSLRLEREKLVKELHNNVCENKVETKSVKEFFEKTPVKTLWMRPFTISSEIENVAYQVKKGECSAIKTSENGNFFVKVLDERPSAGIVFLEYMFNKDKEKLEMALDSLNNGAKWNDVKKNFSTYEGVNGYFQKPRFEADLPESFYAQIQKMDGKKYSEPFSDNDGWYILNVLRQDKFDDFQNWENYIHERIQQSDYALNYVTYSETQAMQKVDVTENQDALNEVIKTAGKNFFSNKKELNLTSNKVIWKTENQEYKQGDLIKELNFAKKYFDEKTDFDALIKEIIPRFKKQFLLNEYVQHLELYEPAYAADIDLLREAIMVNHYVDSEIYSLAENTDSLEQFIQKNPKKYSWPERYDLEIFRFKTLDQQKKIEKMLKKRKSSEEILKEFEGEKDAQGAISVILTKDKFYPDDGYLSSEFNPKKKIQTVSMFNQKVLIRNNGSVKPGLKTVKEGGMTLKEDYKSWLYAEKIKNLRTKATISIPDAFN